MVKPKGRERHKNKYGKHRPRRIDDNLSDSDIKKKFDGIQYMGSPKHKQCPQNYGLPPFQGPQSDRSFCDKDTQFTKGDLARVNSLFQRSRSAGLVSKKIIWTIDNTGWIYELQVTNACQNIWHGYPLLTGDIFAPTIIKKFSEWAKNHGTADDRKAAESAGQLYGVK